MPKNQLHEHLPHNIVRIMDEKECPQCKRVVGRESTVAIGLREIDSGEKTIYVEYWCPFCENQSILALMRFKNPNLKQVCRSLLEEILATENTNRSVQREAQSVGSTKDRRKIGKKEASDFVKFMKSNDDHDLFMEEIGATRYMRSIERKDEANGDETP